MLARRTILAGVTTLVDAVNAEATLAAHGEARHREVALADRIALTKSDLVAAPDRVARLARLRRRRPARLEIRSRRSWTPRPENSASPSSSLSRSAFRPAPATRTRAAIPGSIRAYAYAGAVPRSARRRWRASSKRCE